jgi:flagellar capping protein FliD
LSYQAYIAIRRSYSSSSTIRCPQSQYDFISSTAVANKTTLNGNVLAGAATATLTSGTGFTAAGNYCMSNGSSRVEFFTVTGQSANVITIDDSNGFKIAHTSGDAVADNADVGSIWLPGGDLWYVTPVNNSGQTVIMGAYADIDVGDTATY